MLIKFTVTYANLNAIIYNRGMTVRFTLWNQKAKDFDMKEYEEAEKPATIVVTSCIVKVYGGEQNTLSLSTVIAYKDTNHCITLFRSTAIKHGCNSLLLQS